jgi:hypothetical protein
LRRCCRRQGQVAVYAAATAVFAFTIILLAFAGLLYRLPRRRTPGFRPV